MALVVRSLLAIAAGFFVYASYEPHGWWLLGIFGMTLLYAALMPWQQTIFYRVLPALRSSQITLTSTINRRSGALLGFLHGLSLYLLLLPWIGEFVGAMPFIVLSIYLALWSLAFGIGAAILFSHPWAVWGYPFLYLAFEWGRSHFPFGGFAWVRLAWGQINGPLAQLAPLGGVAFVSFATVCLGVAIAHLFSATASQHIRLFSVRTNQRAVSVIIVSTFLAISGIAFFTNGSADDTGSVRIAAIQGNVPRLGLDFNAQRRAVLENHVRETERLNQQVDLVIWPENSSDVNPFTDSQAATLIEEAVESVQAPILVGTITRDDIGPRNTMVVMDPHTGRGEQHNKKYLQPFGEYIPWRNFFRRFSPLVDLAGNFQPGTGTGVVHMTAALSNRVVAVGIATCYEVAFDAAGRDAVLAGAEILTTPTNNATFGFTDMTYQQLAMSRMRALELDRAVVVAATSGVSALVAPDGKVLSHTEIFESATLSADLPLRTHITYAARIGSALEYVLVFIGILGVMLALWQQKRPARTFLPADA
nr:apolipoprotein N-acyltransferase [Corynebacterium kutscheri]